ncbi:hypothetical protein SDC9_154590 [bioreactor metagenome]|uniref:Uncharacterized protein n=1 Tax=bioreactor metagenome TaxID=1076179 RepID=A0A645F3Y9_9ZZZZ
MPAHRAGAPVVKIQLHQVGVNGPHPADGIDQFFFVRQGDVQIILCIGDVLRRQQCVDGPAHLAHVVQRRQRQQLDFYLFARRAKGDQRGAFVVAHL